MGILISSLVGLCAQTKECSSLFISILAEKKLFSGSCPLFTALSAVCLLPGTALPWDMCQAPQLGVSSQKPHKRNE